MRIVVALCLLATLLALRFEQHEQTADTVEYIYTKQYYDEEHPYSMQKIRRLCFGGRKCICSRDNDSGVIDLTEDEKADKVYNGAI